MMRHRLTATVVGAALAVTAWAGAAHAQAKEFRPGYLLLREAKVAWASGKEQTLTCPTLTELRPDQDDMQMYLRFRSDKPAGRVQWVHFSQIKSAQFKQGLIDRGLSERSKKEAAERHVDPKTLDAWRRMESKVQTSVLVILNNGRRLTGSTGELYFDGTADGKPVSCPTVDRALKIRPPSSTPDDVVTAVVFTGFAALSDPDETPKPREDGRNDIECTVRGRDLVRDWLNAGRGQPGKPAGFRWQEKVLTPREASDLWQANRSKTERWTMTEDKTTTTVPAWGVNSRLRTNRTGSVIYVNAEWLESYYEPSFAFKSITFSGVVPPGNTSIRTTVDVVPARAVSETINIGHEDMGWDYVFMWQTDYGFEGASVLPVRKVTFKRE